MGRTEIAAQNSYQDWKRIVPGLVVSAICLAVVFYFVDFHKLMASLRLADYRLIAISILMTIGWIAVRGLVWRTLLQKRATYPQVFFTITEGYLLNNILPFRLGEVGRAFLLSRKARLDFWQVLSTILIERALDMVMAAALLLSTLPFVVGAANASQTALLTGGVFLAGLFILFLLARNRDRAIALFDQLSSRWPFLRRFGGNAIGAFLNGLAILNDGKLFLSALGWMLLNWGAAVFQYYLLLLAFAPQSKFLWAAFTLAVAALGMAAPSSPGALGVYEAAALWALSLFKLDASTAVAFAITAHLLNYVITGALGIYALSLDGESLLGLYRQIRRLPQNNPS